MVEEFSRQENTHTKGGLKGLGGTEEAIVAGEQWT